MASAEKASLFAAQKYYESVSSDRLMFNFSYANYLYALKNDHKLSFCILFNLVHCLTSFISSLDFDSYLKAIELFYTLGITILISKRLV